MTFQLTVGRIPTWVWRAQLNNAQGWHRGHIWIRFGPLNFNFYWRNHITPGGLS